MIPRILAPLLIALLLTGCLQFETPHTFMEDEEVKIRAKNLSRYYQDLEEQIRREQYHIKLLEGTLHINLTSEQTLSEQGLAPHMQAPDSQEVPPGQARSQLPQFAASELTAISQPLLASRSQSAKPGMQVRLQLPVWQRA